MSKKSFSEKVYQACKKIESGRVSTYGEIARFIGCSKAARAVGNALNKNPFSPRVPCHRVVKSDHSVGGFAGGSLKKVKMLQEEGILVKSGKVQNFNQFFYKLKG